jgi:glycosyltransferase involved in cell wall biosynthesis
MRIVFFDFVIHFGGGPQLAADTVGRLAKVDGIDIQVMDAYGKCQPYLEKLKKAKVKVHIMLPDAKKVWIGYQNNKLIRIWRMLCQVPAFWRLRRKLIRKIRKINPDIMWSNSPKGMLLLGSILALRQYPLAREYIGCLDAALIPRYDRWMMRYRADIVMAISTETAKQLQLAGVPEDKIRIVFDTIDLEDTLKRSTLALEAPLPGLDKHPRLFIAATLFPSKGQDTVIKAVGRLKTEGYDPTLWVAGDVFDNDQSYLKHMQDMVAELGVSENVHFLGWRYDIPAIINKSEIVIVASHAEGFCHVVLEGMLLKRPVVATAVGGLKDSIEDGINGLIFPVDNDKMLADCIKRLVGDEQLAAVITENGYKTVTERFNQDNHTDKVAAALREAVERKPTR